MAPFLRKGLQCFYCGCRSTQAYTVGLTQWHCISCDAVNHLDANGEITDPPADAVNLPRRFYTRNTNRSVSPLSGQPNDVFCQTCIKNQTLKAQNLADYLPPSSDPTYAAYERLLPEYSRKLDERYPQVCADCAPRVNQRLREAGYTAKTEFLRQRLDGTYKTKKSASRWDVPPILAYFGCIGWCAGLMGQVLWHIQRICAYSPNLAVHVSKIQLGLGQTLGFSSSNDVTNFLSPKLLKLSIQFAILCCWWNPKMLHSSRLGVSNPQEFYKLQIILLAVRMSAMYYLQPGSMDMLDLRTVAAIHTITLFFDVAISLSSYRIATPARSPSISLREDLALSMPQTTERIAATTSSAQRTSSTHAKRQPFSISQLATQNSSSFLPPFGNDKDINYPARNFDHGIPSTNDAPVEDDMMDLDPPATPHRYQAWRSTATEGSEADTDRTFSSQQAMTERYPKRTLNVTAFVPPSGIRTEEAVPEKRPNRKSDVKFAEPRFYAPSTGDTGLEALMSGVFSLSDTPAELRQPQSAQEKSSQPSIDSNAFPGSIRMDILTLVAVSVGCLCMYLAMQLETTQGTQQYTMALAIVGLVSALNLFRILGASFIAFSLADTLLCVLQGAVALHFLHCGSACDTRHSSAFVYGSCAVQILFFARSVTIYQTQDTSIQHIIKRNDQPRP